MTPFTNNEANAKAAGVYIGAYHFAHPTTPPSARGGLLLELSPGSYIKADGKSLMPMLDFEVGNTPYGASSRSDWVNQWCLAVSNRAAAAGITIKPVVYCSSSGRNQWFTSTVTNWIPWIAEWHSTPDPQTGAPSPTSPWSTWVVWQDTNTDALPGVGIVDGDVFNGTAAQLVSTLVITNSIVVTSTPPVIAGLGLYDLGTAGTNRLNNTHGVRLFCKVDVSKDGTLAGATDGNTNAFLWTPGNGKVTLGSSMSLVGADWFSNQVIAVINTNGGYYPARWLGNVNGASGIWTNLPAANGAAGTNGYWKATSLAVAADSTDWWLAGYTSGGTQNAMLRYKYSSASATSINLPSSGHANSYFWAAADVGEFAGTAEYDGSGFPGGGSVNGVKYLANPSTWLGPPEAGGGTTVSTAYTCIAEAISGDGNVAGGADKNGVPNNQALYWDANGNVSRVPWVLISGTTYADWMEVHSLNKDGTIMGGVYYTNPPTDSDYEAFVYYVNSNSVVKVSALLAASGANTNGWTFKDVTALSDDGNTLVGWGITNGQRHAWIALRLIIGSVAVTNVTCNGSANGSITVAAFGGGGALQYSKDNGASWQTNNPTFTGLASGSYTVKVRDTNAYTASYSNNPVTITQPTAVTISAVTSNNVTCNGGNDGSITVSASGGTGTLQYSKDNGATWQTNNPTFTGLASGSYPVKVRDANLCTATYGAVPISQPTAVTISAVSSNNVTCNGGNNGSITVAASGGTGALQYSKDNGTTWQTNNATFTGLVSGSYTVKVRDANLCTATYGAVPISQPTAVTISAVTSNNVTCNGGNNGSITVAASGGTGALQYSKDNGTTWQTNNATFTGLVSGSYTVKVRDANLCTATYGAVPISQPTAVTISAVTSNNVTCNGGSDASITVTASGGTGTLQYSRDNGVSWQTNNPTFTGLASGSYTVKVRDANLCTATYGAVPISQPTAVTISAVTSNNVTCNGGSDGSITVTASGGTGTLQYSRDNGVSWQTNNPTFTGLASGSYTVKVQDANLCTATYGAVPISQPTAVTISAVTSNNVTCNGGSDGSITVTASGGTGTLQYSRDNGVSWQTNNPTFTGLASGSYTVKVQDANLCTATYGAVPISQPTAVTISAVTSNNVTCNGGSDGSITVTASGGTGTLQYSRDNGVSWQTNNPTFTGLASGSYTVKVQDANLCTATYGAVPISQPTAVTISAVTSNNVTCNGGSDGSITVTASGGTGTLQYSRDNGVSWQTNNPTFTGLASGSYTVKVQDANLCTATYGAVPISQPTAVTISAVTSNNVTCNGGSDGSITVTASGGTGTLQYSRDNGVSWQTNNPTFTGLASGSYIVEVHDASGCTAIYGSNPVTLTQPAVLSASAAPDTTISLGASYSLNGSASGGNGGYAYGWSPDAGLSSTNIANPTASPTNTTLYTLTVTDALGCAAQAQVNVMVTLSPTLGITLSGTDLVLSWPALAAYADFSLQENSDVATTNWTAVTNTPVNDGTSITVTLPVPSSNQFYRLIK